MAKESKQIKIVTLDTETLGLDGAIKRIAIYDGEEVIYGYTFADVEPYLLMMAKGFSVHVYIHNLEFDLRKIQEVFNGDNVIWSQCLLINGKFAKLTCKNYIIHDSYKILPLSLDELSKSFKLEHGKLDLWEEIQKRYPDEYKDKVDFFINCHKDNSLYLEYLGFDVISLYELITRLIYISGLSEKDFVGCITSASMSKKIFKKGFKGDKFKTSDNEKTDYQQMTIFNRWQSIKNCYGDSEASYFEVEKKIRSGYFGGRTEVFKPLLEGVLGFHYDVNSLYPSAMIDNFFPVGFPQFYSKKESVKIKYLSWLKNHEGLGFIKAHVFVPYQHIPPLPVKREKLCFLCGHLDGMWTFPELEYAIKNCGVEVIEYKEMVYFPKTFKVFHNFISVFARIKEIAKENEEFALVYFAKLLLNTAYGYTGMRREKTAMDSIENLGDYSETLIYANEEYGYLEYLSVIDSESIQPQIASYVTSYARIILLDAMRIANEKGEIYYCDTDSIVTDKEFPPEMVHKTKLGKWDLENTIVSGVFLQPKVYSEISTKNKQTIKFKGVTKNRQKELDFDYYMFLKSVLEEKKEEKFLIEKDIKRFHSVRVQMKKNEDLNYMENIDKYINVLNKQKRIMLFNENKTLAYFMPSIDYFYSFSFKLEIPRETKTSILDMVI